MHSRIFYPPPLIILNTKIASMKQKKDIVLANIFTEKRSVYDSDEEVRTDKDSGTLVGLTKSKLIANARRSLPSPHLQIRRALSSIRSKLKKDNLVMCRADENEAIVFSISLDKKQKTYKLLVKERESWKTKI